MSQEKGLSLNDIITRRLHPVRILVNYLNNEMSLNDGDDISMDRVEFESIVSTLEIFIEEFDRVTGHQLNSRSKKKKFSSSDAKNGMKAAA